MKTTKLNKLITTALAAVAVTVGAVSTASAQNPGFELGNLILGFQSTGTGSGSYVLANIGDSATFRDYTTNQINVFNVNAALSAQFGSTWYNSSSLYVGLGASWSNDEFGPSTRNGDLYNTIYIGIPRQTVGVEGSAGSVAPFLTGAQVQDASNGLYAVGDRFETNGTGAVSAIASSLYFTDYNDQNPITAGVQGNSYNGVFSGGTQYVFGPGNFGTFGGIQAESALDLYRIDSETGTSTFKGTAVLDQAGNVSYIVTAVPEASTYAFLAFGALGLVLVSRRYLVKA